MVKRQMQAMAEFTLPSPSSLSHSHCTRRRPATAVVPASAPGVSPVRKSNVSSAQSSPRSAVEGGSKRPTSKSMQTEEERAKLETVREEMLVTLRKCIHSYTVQELLYRFVPTFFFGVLFVFLCVCAQ